jgi:uncharacterized membrane protein
MIFTSHLISMVIYAAIVSILIAFIRYDIKREIFRYSLKLFIYMVGGVIIFSWFMYLF